MSDMNSHTQSRIYLDHASATACSDTVVESMLPFFSNQYVNPGGLYREAVDVGQHINKSRLIISEGIGARPNEIYFTDGATESNNLAIIGTIRSWQKQNPTKTAHVITTVVEHAAVLEAVRFLEKDGVLVTYLDVNEHGQISLKELKKEIQENTVVVSIGYVNGEIGTISDIRSIMKTIRHARKTNNKSRYPYMHTDAVQAVNYVDNINVLKLGVDLLTFNASKIYGPKKIATLFVKTGVSIDSILYGGGQERGLRSGTENVPYIVGFAKAFAETRSLQDSEIARLVDLQKYLEHSITEYDSEIILNSAAESKIPNIVNISIPNLSHEEIVIRLDAVGFMCSVKSACKAGEEGDSHVIKALRADTTGSLRISLGRDTTHSDCVEFMKSFITIVDTMKDTYEKYYKK